MPEDKTTEDSRGRPPGVTSREPTEVTLQVGDETQTQAFRILKDPRVAASQEDLEAQFQMLVEIRDKVSETHDGINRLRRVRQQVDQWVSRAHGPSRRRRRLRSRGGGGEGKTVGQIEDLN